MSAALDPYRTEEGVILNVVTMDLPIADPCDGTMTCSCETCTIAKVRPIKQVRQPWEPLQRAA